MLGPTAVHPIATPTATPPRQDVENVVIPAPVALETSEPSRPIFVLDWDDTLLPNTHLALLGFVDESREFVLSEQTLAGLEKVTDQVACFLTSCLSLGSCHIVTNAEEGWVQRSCQRFMPRLLPLLDRAQIISARSRYQSMFPHTPVEWKIAAFTELLKTEVAQAKSDVSSVVSSVAARQIFSIGDATTDRQAIQYVAKRAPQVQLKSVKFLENPTMFQLERQLCLMCNFLPQLATHKDNLDLVLSPSMLR